MTPETPAARTAIDATSTIGATHLPLRERVRDLLRDRIVRGDFAPGDRLVERVLAEEMGVSRVPVREALTLLKGEGFVQDVPRRGVIVTVLAKEDVDDLFDVRVALDVQCARLASARATDDEIRALAAIADAADAALARGDLGAIAELNQAFHDAVPRMAHNRILASTLEPLEGRLHWVLRQNRSPEILLAEHRELVEALAKRDGDAAADVALRHVDTSRRLCHEIMFGDES
ncbi:MULTISPECIES: GntR family transcriptional regulator [Microbacterium]|uniref:GntR family transcriptional regulator n=1 Tax=Microbacterium TaxID=33882 RepID=UPI00285EAF05|nr:GntR family transcriptional regulator [Microbacterium trichothecenolyticum]MDR7185104.1 DNA-binding GntR family transcriptional regulator [Microbacterium trichothecenolyticum]